MVNFDQERTDGIRLSELTSEAEHAGRRYSLYRARVHGPKPTSPGRLLQLKRDADRAQTRLDRAKTNA